MSERTNENFKFFPIVKPVDFPDGERLFFELNGNPIVLFSLNGEYLATGDICTHDKGSIGEGELEGDVIVCPRHGARFDIRTGKTLSLPAVTDIPVYAVRVVEGYIEVGIPE
ncbi:MAG: dioxygenase ferredoxin subunit [Chloroflexi bacterium]|nr:MAG: dioxygenase ferredoxin subunit [Chloroflexota bacterium]MBA4375000.1 biphenyl 2,3-dioxygenase [Anaerolinea sp.]